jgi:hypothetical protein
MLKQDKQTFLEFVSGEAQRVETALADLNSRERGHFENHPMSSRFIAEHIQPLIQLWNDNPVSGCREWVAQFLADARVADQRIKPLIAAQLADLDCRHLPTLLYLVGTQPGTFGDIGHLLLGLARHPDKEVRWRVAWAISKMGEIDTAMRQAIQVLKAENDHTAQVYVAECEKRAEQA